MKNESAPSGEIPENGDAAAPRKLRLSEMVAKALAEGDVDPENDKAMWQERTDMAIARLEQRRQIKPVPTPSKARPAYSAAPARKSHAAHVHDAIQQKEDEAFERGEN